MQIASGRDGGRPPFWGCETKTAENIQSENAHMEGRSQQILV